MISQESSVSLRQRGHALFGVCRCLDGRTACALLWDLTTFTLWILAVETRAEDMQGGVVSTVCEFDAADNFSQEHF